jgi:c-di-GMP-binding flagellar brake protein YcgR
LNKDGESSEFVSRIKKIREKSYILEMPVRQTGSMKLKKGDIVEIRYNKKDAAYTFKASIKDLFVGNAGSIEISELDKPTAHQRRKNVRLDIAGDVTFRIIESPDSKDVGVSTERSGRLLNISAGGFLIETNQNIKNGSIIMTNFTLRNGEKLENILSIINRSEKLTGSAFLIGSEFIPSEKLAEFGLEKLMEFLPPDSGAFDERLQELVVRLMYKHQLKSG